MEVCQKDVIKNESENVDLFVLLSAMAEIRPFLVDAGLALRHGLVIFAEDWRDCDKTEKELLNLGAIECKTLGKKRSKVRNHLVGIHRYMKTDKEEAVQEFLVEEEFIPVLLTYGMIPDFLENQAEILPVFKSGETKMLDTLKEFELFRLYAHRNPDILQREIELFMTSQFYLQNEESSSLSIVLEATATVFCSLFRNWNTEQETNQRREKLKKVIECIVYSSEEYGEEYEFLEIVKRTVEEFIEENPQILICRYDEIEGEVINAVYNSTAILFDDEYYYLPDGILRKACEPILCAISLPRIKRQLFEEGYLHCANAKKGHYTVKKMVTNSYGIPLRVRFLKISREFFAPIGEMGLEERREW